jgi:hypothetical protein
MVKVSGKVLANYRKGKDQNWLFIASSLYGRMIVRATLQDEEAKHITRDDYVQLSGKPRRRCRILEDGTVAKDVLIMKPVIERVIHTERIIK